MSRCAPVWLLAFGLGAAALAQETPEGKGYAEEPVLVRRVVWPVLIQPTRKTRDSGVCDRLTPRDIRITEDGTPRPVKSLARRPLRQIHALLIDTSVSMKISERLEHAKEAAARYIERLPEDERVLVATFDDSLVMVAPPTLDRESLTTAIDAIEPGNYTALWDALSELVGYLDEFPVQKTIVLLSDGEDSSSMSELDTRDVLERVGARPDLSIFPIGIDLHSHADSDTFRTVLRRMATATGGLFFETHGVMGVDAAFERLSRHLERRFYATYEPLAPDQGGPTPDPRARPGERRVRASAARGTPCKVSSAGPPTRFVLPPHPVPRPAESPFVETESAIADIGACLDLPNHRSVTHELALPTPTGWPGLGDEPGAVYVLDPPGMLAARTPDVLVERGLLYSRKAYENAGRYRLTIDRKPRIRSRTVAIEVPEFAYVRRVIRSPEEVLMHLLQKRRCLDSPGARHPLFVHGKTLLEMRESIAQALFEHYPDYRAWAQARLVAEAAPGVDALIDEFARSETMTASRRKGMRSTLLARAAVPKPEEPQRHLAEWLGDVSARDLVEALEARLAGALLDPLGRAEELPLAEHLERAGFDLLNAWFPPANQVRVLAPLLPAYDVERNVIGFYRVVLPRPRLAAPPIDPIPPGPYGLHLARYLLESGAWDTTTTGGLRLAEIRHVVPDEPHHRALLQQLRRFGRSEGERGATMHGVVIDVTDHEVEGALAELTVVFGARAEQPSVISACLVGDASEAMSGLLDRLAGLDGYRQLSCSARDSIDDDHLRRDPMLR